MWSLCINRYINFQIDSMDKAQLIADLCKWSATSENGFFVTLNGLTYDKISFEQDLGKFAHKLNDYCYGRAYKRKDKRLKIIAGVESGQLNRMLHAHLVIQHDDQMRRTLTEVNAFIRSQWYGFIGLRNSRGNMVNIAPLGIVETRISYITKDTNYLNRNGYFNLIWL